MQNRLKYRFWHKPTNKMMDCYGYNKDFVFADTLDGVGTTYNPAKFDDCILMQCTGLKDKNGKLIYEGDVVNGTCGVYWGKMIVKFNENEAKFYMYRIDKRYTDLHFHGKNQEDNFELEVIGNIYENPELLEV